MEGKKIKLDDSSAAPSATAQSSTSTSGDGDVEMKPAEDAKSAAPADKEVSGTGKSESEASAPAKSDSEAAAPADKDASGTEKAAGKPEWSHDTLSPASIAMVAIFFFVVLRILTWSVLDHASLADLGTNEGFLKIDRFWMQGFSLSTKKKTPLKEIKLKRRKKMSRYIPFTKTLTSTIVKVPHAVLTCVQV